MVVMLRLLKIVLNGIKDVDHGEVVFNEYKFIKKGDFSYHRPGIIGIYGQNGSGKTTIINSLSFLKTYISGKSTYENEFDYQCLVSKYLRVGNMNFTFYFEDDNNAKYLIEYGISLKEREKETFITDSTTSFVTKDESLNISKYDEDKKEFISQIKNLKIDFLDEKNTDIKGRKVSSLMNQLFSRGITQSLVTQNFINIALIKGAAYQNGSSFFFNNRFLESIKENKVTLSFRDKFVNLLSGFKASLVKNLLIYTTLDDAMGSVGVGSFLGGVSNEEIPSFGKIGYGTMGINKVSLKEYNVYVSLVKQINIVVPAFIPNFKLKILDVGAEIFSNGENGKRIEFMSVVNGADIPLIAESNGVKKIVNLCSAIIYMYNNPSTILVIDEFDSGVFEYLFGQILDILSKFAKGQLLFTSHNLRQIGR